MKYLTIFVVLVAVVTSGLMVAYGIDTTQTYLPFVSKGVEYPFNGWVVADRWVIDSVTYIALFHPEGWRLTARCLDPNLPAPELHSPCVYLGGSMFNCGYGYQNFAVIELIVTPTATNTPLPTYTSTPTELPTDTPEPTLHPPTGVTNTPTPEVTK